MEKLAILQDKIIDIKTLVKRTNGWKLKSEKIVFTNGCFDILHRGHIKILAAAADCGNRLIVGVNTDASVKRLKGPTRPINNQEDRALLLAALAQVDAVVLFDEDTPLEVIKALRPDVLVKGGDYTIETVVGSDVVAEYGGKTEIIDLESGYSTTNIIKKSKEI